MPLEDVTSTPLPRLAPRPANSHKGDFGRALLVGGSRGMSGAISLAGLAALRSGAGLVTLAVPRSIQDVVATYSPCYMTKGLDEDENGRIAKSAVSNLINPLEISKFTITSPTAIGFGPGLGRADTITELAGWVYQVNSEPMVVDADALYALAQRPEEFAKPGGPRILTPHPGEFDRLTGQTHIESRRVEVAAELARGVDDLHYQYRDKAAQAGAKSARPEVIVVLKGHETVVTDGHRYAINHTGNPGMATGGTGDVLTGVITALLCQGLAPFDAARLGVHVHGLAGDLAAAELGQVSLVASDVIDFLPHAFQRIDNQDV